MDRKEYQAEWVRKKRARLSEGSVSTQLQMSTLPPILIDPIKRDKVYRICQVFAKSHHPEYTEMAWVGGHCLSCYMCMFNLA